MRHAHCALLAVPLLVVGCTRVGIYNHNLESTQPRAEWMDKMGRFTKALAEDESIRRADILALNEVFIDGYNFPMTLVPCPETGDARLPAQCIEAMMERETGENWTSGQYHEVGIVARENEELQLVNSSVAGCRLGTTAALQRMVIGARYFVPKWNQTLPVWSVHLSGVNTDYPNNWWQVEDMKRCIREHWIPGDLTPVVTGDFNFTSGLLGGLAKATDLDLENHMEEDFDIVPANDRPGKATIEWFWIGKLDRFPKAAGRVSVVGGNAAMLYEYSNEPDSHNVSDHPAAHVELTFP